MKRLVLSMAVAPMLLGSFASLSAADDGFKIFDEVKFKGELRPRAGYVDSKAISDAGVDAGMGLTNRTNLNFSAKLFQVDGLNRLSLTQLTILELKVMLHNNSLAKKWLLKFLKLTSVMVQKLLQV